jgi:transposase
MKHNRRRRAASRVSPSVLDRINPDSAGIDCGAAELYVAVPPDRDRQPVQRFQTFTTELHRLADWLTTCRIRSVAMEATGVYWIPAYTVLEARGFEVLLVNPRHLKHVAARKSDVLDCEWLRDLQIVGLLRGSFRPTAAIVALREYLRHRQTVTELISESIQRMQKALLQMNLQLTRVVTDITGVTGLRIIRDIVAGRRDPAQLAQHRDRRCHATVAEITAALTGHYGDEHVFALQQHLALFDVYHQHLAQCDAAIDQHVQRLAALVTPPAAPLPARRTASRTPRRQEPTFEIRSPLYHLTGGVDLTQIDGIGAYSALRLVSEIGTDMTRWPTEKHFTSWLTLAPNNRISGGRLLSARTPPSANRAAAILRMAAMTLGRTATALGAFYRRLAARVGKPHAITATARKLAVLVYRMLNGDLVYRDPGADAYHHQQRGRRLRDIRQRAAALGFDLLDRATGEVVQLVTP